MTRGWAVAYWGCAAGHALGHAIGSRPLRVATKSAMMPALAGWARSNGCPRTLVGALLFSAAGDSLMEQNILLPGMALYAAAHSCYVGLFVRDRQRFSWRSITAYAGLGGAVMSALWPGLGRLRAPVTAYSLMLTATATTASWYGRRTGVGGALFLLSDVLIGAKLAGHDFPTRGPLVGLTYTVGQYHLASGVIRRIRRS